MGRGFKYVIGKKETKEEDQSGERNDNRGGTVQEIK